MAIDPSIILRLQNPDLGSALSSGLQTGQNLKMAGLRERLTESQIQKSEQDQALQGVVNYANLVDGLANVPLVDRSKLLAQNIPMLEASGIPAAQLTSMDLSDSGLRNVQAGLKPFLAKQKAALQQPANIQTYQFYQGVLKDPQASEEEKQAAKIALKLEAPAKAYTPKLVEIGGAKYMQVGTDLYNPQTMAPVATDESGLPVGAPVGATVQALTPEAQQEQIAAGEAAKVKAKAMAEAEVTEAEEGEKETSQANQTIGVIDSILGSERLDNITGLSGALPFSLPGTQDLLGQVQQLKSLLTANNLGIMSGVLSESDMKIIQGLSNDIIIDTDEQGNVTRIKGSEKGTRKKLKQIKDKLTESLNSNGMYLEGQKAKSADGRIAVYRNGQWVIE